MSVSWRGDSLEPVKLDNPNSILLMDEPAYQVYETEQRSSITGALHRYQYMSVVRSDKLVAYRKDLGPASLYRSRKDFVYLAGYVDFKTGRGDTTYTVSELQDVADQMRDRPDGTEQIEPRNFMQELSDDLERVQLELRGITTSGPLITVQRS